MKKNTLVRQSLRALISGVAKNFIIFAKGDKLKLSSDKEALKEDWLKIGQDINATMQNIEVRNGGSKKKKKSK